MTADGIDVRISNLGGITSAELRLEPGVNVLTGANGAGKTSAMRAVSRALGADVPVEVRDGADHGSAERAAAVAALNHARGFLRSRLAGRLRLRAVPDLEFHLDRGAEHSERISRLLEELGDVHDEDS